MSNRNLSPDQFGEPFDIYRHLNDAGGRDAIRGRMGTTDHLPPEIQRPAPEPGVYVAENPAFASRRDRVMAAAPARVALHCRHCDRGIEMRGGSWVDPQATGDDHVWRETCDAHDTFEANHEPGPVN